MVSRDVIELLAELPPLTIYPAAIWSAERVSDDYIKVQLLIKPEVAPWYELINVTDDINSVKILAYEWIALLEDPDFVVE